MFILYGLTPNSLLVKPQIKSLNTFPWQFNDWCRFKDIRKLTSDDYLTLSQKVLLQEANSNLVYEKKETQETD